MPPSKRSSTKTSAGTAPRAKRGRSSAATSVAISDSVTLVPASDATSSSSSGTVSIDVAALSPQCLPWYQKSLRPPSRPKP